MSYEVFRYIFIGALVLSIVFFIAAVVLFFVLEIRDVIGFFTGSHKKREIENIKKGTHEVKHVNPIISYEEDNTSKLNPQDRYDNMVQVESKKTESVSTPVRNNVNVVQNASQTVPRTVEDGFVIVKEITFVHSNEVIKNSKGEGKYEFV